MKEVGGEYIVVATRSTLGPALNLSAITCGTRRPDMVSETLNRGEAVHALRRVDADVCTERDGVHTRCITSCQSGP